MYPSSSAPMKRRVRRLVLVTGKSESMSPERDEKSTSVAMRSGSHSVMSPLTVRKDRSSQSVAPISTSIEPLTVLAVACSVVETKMSPSTVLARMSDRRSLAMMSPETMAPWNSTPAGRRTTYSTSTSRERLRPRPSPPCSTSHPDPRASSGW